MPLGTAEPDAPGKIGKTLAPLLGMIYALPAYTGFGEHWILEKSEAEALAKQLEECVKQLPKGAAKHITMLLAQYAPWIGLTITAYTITAPRVRQTVEMKRVQNLSRLAGQRSPGAAVHAASGNGSDGPPTVVEQSGGKPRPSARKLFEDG